MINRSKLKKKAHKLLIKTKITIDYTGGAFFLILAIVVYVAATPWILKKKPKFFSYLENNGFAATAVPLRELLIAFGIINFCIEERIGVLRAYKHDYVARHPETSKKIGLQGRDFARIVFDKEKIRQKESMFYKKILQR